MYVKEKHTYRCDSCDMYWLWRIWIRYYSYSVVIDQFSTGWKNCLLIVCFGWFCVVWRHRCQLIVSCLAWINSCWIFLTIRAQCFQRYVLYAKIERSYWIMLIQFTTASIYITTFALKWMLCFTDLTCQLCFWR